MQPVETRGRRLAALDAYAARKRCEHALVEDLKDRVIVSLRVLELVTWDPSRGRNRGRPGVDVVVDDEPYEEGYQQPAHHDGKHRDLRSGLDLGRQPAPRLSLRPLLGRLRSRG